MNIRHSHRGRKGTIDTGFSGSCSTFDWLVFIALYQIKDRQDSIWGNPNGIHLMRLLSAEVLSEDAFRHVAVNLPAGADSMRSHAALLFA